MRRTAETELPAAPRSSSWATGYAIAVTVLLFFCLLTGRLSLRGNHVLESLPDLKPLGPNEFRKVPEGAELPAGHLLRPGQSRRFGDVVVTPLRITQEPLSFEGFLSGKPEPELTTEPVLKLWVRFDSEAEYAFPPFDSGLMSHRMPIHGTDDSTLANSWLLVRSGDDRPPARVLNYLQSMDSNFVITGQNSGSLLMPGQSLEVCYASSLDMSGAGVSPEALLTWRIQIRKGVHQASGHGVTTLIDVEFRGSDIQVGGTAAAEHEFHESPRIASASQ